MEWISLGLIGISLIGGIGIWLWQRHREQRFPLTQHTVRCPLYDRQATLTVRTNPIARPRGQYVDVTACSILPATPCILPASMAYLPDMPSYEPYLQKARPHRYTLEVPCRKDCLYVLNEAEGSCPIRHIRCTSGISNGLELTRQVVQNPTITRLLWFHSV